MASSALNEEQYPEEEKKQQDTDKNGETLGQLLSSTRKSNRLSLEKAARIIRVSEVYLEALEEDNHEKLPEQVYTIGFIKSYATYLDLDPQELVEKYKKQTAQSSKENVLDFPVPAPERHIPSKWLIVIATFLGLLIFVAWNSIHPWKPSAPSVDNITPEVAYEQGMDKAPGSVTLPQDPTFVENNIVDKKNEDPLSLPEPETTEISNVVLEGKKLYLGPGDHFLIIANHPSWIEVKTKDGKVLLNKTLKTGESEDIKARDGLTFSTGNAGDISFYIDGRTYSPLGKPGQIMSGLQLQFEFKT